jgi:hypothetical protein
LSLANCARNLHVASEYEDRDTHASISHRPKKAIIVCAHDCVLDNRHSGPYMKTSVLSAQVPGMTAKTG